jgi:hypothetical protein
MNRSPSIQRTEPSSRLNGTKDTRFPVQVRATFVRLTRSPASAG